MIRWIAAAQSLAFAPRFSQRSADDPAIVHEARHSSLENRFEPVHDEAAPVIGTQPLSDLASIGGWHQRSIVSGVDWRRTPPRRGLTGRPTLAHPQRTHRSMPDGANGLVYRTGSSRCGGYESKGLAAESKARTRPRERRAWRKAPVRSAPAALVALAQAVLEHTSACGAIKAQRTPAALSRRIRK